MSANNEMKPPILMNCKELLVPVGSSKDRIRCIIDEVHNGTSSQIINEGLFILAVASIETMVLDILRYYLRSFPEKLGKKTFSINKDDLLYRPRSLVEEEVDKELNSVSYENIEQILEYFNNTLSLDQALLSIGHSEQLREIKASRNLLLHNNLVVNNIYIEKAGPQRRERETSKKLEIDTVYLKETLVLFDTICDLVTSALSVKYESYTKVASIKRLWQYLFSSPVMVFEDYWQVDPVKDRVVSYKGSKYEDDGLLSSSEMMFLGMWRAHFHGRASDVEMFSMYSLDKMYQSKMLYFLSVLDDFRLE